jgi:type II secretory pathway component PulK
MTRARDSGVVLPMVLFFALLLVSSVATFTRRSVIDSMISINRDAGARAEALARGGVRLAEAVILEDLALSNEDPEHVTLSDTRGVPIQIDDGRGGALTLRIEDSSSRLNLNALFVSGDDGNVDDLSLIFLEKLLTLVVDEMDIPPGEKALYDPTELAANLVDWGDANDIRLQGGPENAYYQEQDPPYQAPNHALLSLDEMRLIEGFDGHLVDALRPYLTVHPYAQLPETGGGGINPNTAPPHVLRLLFYDDGVDLILIKEDRIRQILDLREEGGVFCGDQGGDQCTPISEIVGPNPIYPPPSYNAIVFRVLSEARVGDVRRSILAVIDTSQLPQPRRLSWRVR